MVDTITIIVKITNHAHLNGFTFFHNLFGAISLSIKLIKQEYQCCTIQLNHKNDKGLCRSNTSLDKMQRNSETNTNTKLCHLRNSQIILQWRRITECSKGVVCVHQS